MRANYLASPPLVVAYALKGTVIQDMVDTPIGQATDGHDVYLKDIWPSNEEIRSLIDQFVNGDMFRARYADVYKGDERWQKIAVTGGDTYAWPAGSTYIANPPYFEGMTMTPVPPSDIIDARPLAILGDSITTDHISPAGAIKLDSPAGKYLSEHQVARADFNSYGARRGNHEVMMRGTFANIRIKNKMVPGIEGGITRYIPTGAQMPIYDAAMLYKEAGTPLVIIAGKEYGTGSSRDWAAKGTNLLGVRAVIAETYERIHRSNLVGMGVLPLQFIDAVPEFDGTETFTLLGVGELKPRQEIAVKVARADGTRFEHSPPASASIPPTSSNISRPAASSIMCCGIWRAERRTERGGHRGRDRRLDRRVADPRRLHPGDARTAGRPLAALPVDERRRRGRLRGQRLVARRFALGDAQRRSGP